VTTVNVSDRSAHDLKVDVLVLATVGVDGSARLAPDHGLPREAASHVETSLQALAAAGSAEEVHTLTGVPGVRAPLVVLIGLGSQAATPAGFDHEVLRRAAGAAVRSVKGGGKVVVSLPAPDEAAVAAIAEGAALGAYRYAGVRGPKA
jgi:leucyl aminopeptidase